MTEYCMRPRTLDNFLNRRHSKPMQFTKTDRAIALTEIAIAGNAELRREIREMREEYNQLVQLVVTQLADHMLQALRNIELPAPSAKAIEKPDALALEGGDSKDAK